MDKLKIGDKVMWRGSFGWDDPAPAIVVAMEVTEEPREKFGNPVDEIEWNVVEENRVLVTLDNGHWAYSEQLSPFTGE